MTKYFRGLWRHPDFLKLWLARTISWMGSHISFFAIPWTAVVWLKPTPFEMGLLSAMQFLPYLLFALIIGVGVDRLKRRPLLILSDIGRALLLICIPALVLSDNLSMGILLLLVLLIGILTVIADVAEEAYLPSLIGRDILMDGYSKLETSISATETIGPGLAGVLIEWLSAPIAIVFDALSFLFSGILLLLIGTEEAAPIAKEQSTSIKTEIIEGLGFVKGQATIRAITSASVTLQLFGGVNGALLILYVTTNLHLPASFVGLIYMAGSVSGLLSALRAQQLTEVFGIGKVLIASTVMISVGWLTIPVAGGLFSTPMIPIIFGMFVTGSGNTLHNITMRTVTQTLTPDDLLGRVNASTRFLAMGALPIGSLLGGIGGTIIGVQTSLIIAGLGMLFAWLWLYFSPLRQIYKLPT